MRGGPIEGLARGALRLLLAGVRALPRRGVRRVLRAFGRAWARLGGPRTDVARVNLAIAFPEKSDAARRALLVDAFGRLAASLADLAELPVLDDARARELVRLEGEEHLEAGRCRSPHGGFILLTAHFGPWELFAAACSLRGYPVSVVHREQSSPVLEGLVDGWRTRAGLVPLRRGSAARAVLRALRDGRVVAMTLDQDTPREEGVFVPFFGRPACTRHAPARIAMRTGCAVVPGFIFPDPAGGGYVGRFRPPLELLPGAGRAGAEEEAVRENTRRMVAAVEEAIRQEPAEWAWIHRRWKTGHDRRNVYKPWRRKENPATWGR